MPGYRGLVGLGGGGLLYRYTSSLSHDREIIVEALLVITAHTLHLAEKRLIDGNTACKSLEKLVSLLSEPPMLDNGESYEDVWEYIEDLLYKETGGASQDVWMGRSRNDHVSAALRLYTLKKISLILKADLEARRRLVEKTGEYRGTPVLLHTHQQPSQLAYLDCLLMGWEEALASAFQIVYSTIGVIDRSPLSASAGAGTLLPLNPERLASLLGFNNVIGSPVYASGSRLDLAAAASAVSLYLVEASRIAGDIIFLSSPYVGVLKLPGDHVATSSIMPHKENPATLEVLRSRARRAQGLLAAMTSIQAGLPTGYSLDLQEANPLLYTLLADALEATLVLSDILGRLEWDTSRLRKLVDEYVAYGAELAEYMTLKRGIPFREAYSTVGRTARIGGLERLMEELGIRDPLVLVGERRIGCTRSPDLGRIEERLERDASRVEALEDRLGTAYEKLPRKAGEVAASLCREN